jgi:hypothetical protein
MMKRTAIFIAIVMIIILGACATVNNEVEAELRATLVAVNVEQTVQAEKIAQLNELLAQPTATCPACPTPEPTCTPFVVTEAPPTPTPAPTERPTGSISGKLGYPSEFIPPLRIVAFNTVTGEYYWQNTVKNQTSYRFSELPAGSYHVLAYLIDNPSDSFYAAYSNFVKCGMTASCEDHNLITVEVKAGQETIDVNPVDWYATDPTVLGWPLDPTIKWD